MGQLSVYFSLLLVLVFETRVIYGKTTDDGVKIATIDDIRGAKSQHVLIVDVRDPEELKEMGYIEGSINIPLGQVRNAFANLSNEKFSIKYDKQKPKFEDPIIFLCRTGQRSKAAYLIVEKLGYTNLKNYDREFITLK